MEKRQWILPCLFLCVIVLFAFIKQNAVTGIRGRVSPYNAVLHVWAVSDTDTARAIVQNGAFEIKNIKAGKYRVIAEGLKPYKVTTKPDVIVNQGVSVDIGEIILDK
jgi:hypothetical protein